MKSALFVVYVFCVNCVFAQTTRPTTQSVQDQLEKEFTQRMANSIMKGQWSDGKNAPKDDSYNIVAVRKLMGDNWMIQAKIGENGITVPLIIPIRWAGDTPVISVTDFGIPGMGTFTARVVIYKDEYAGTWSAGGANPHGGFMWGKIVKAPAATQPTTKPAAK